MASWYDFDEYLQPQHLKGKRHTLTIANWGIREVDNRGKKTTKPVLYFKETRKYFFLNKTQRTAVANLFGEDPAACIGKKIAIQPGKAMNGKDTIDIFAAGTNGVAYVVQERSPLERLWDYAAKYEIPKEVVDRALEQTGGDIDGATKVLENAYELKAA